MSTCNFSQPTLSKIYSIGAQYEEFDWDYELANIQGALSCIPGFHEDMSEPDWFVPRDTNILGYFMWEVRVDKDWEVYKLYITAESGYYCGVKIDVMYDGYTDLSWLNKTAMRRIVQKVNHIERVLSKLTTPIKRVALFSNGEAVYQLA